MATVKLLLDKGRRLRDGSFPLVFRIIHNRRKRMIYTVYKLCTEEYNSISEMVIYISDEHRPQKQVNTMNRAIGEQRLSIDAHIEELELLGEGYAVEQITSRYHIQHDNLSLLGYIDKLIKDKQEIGKTGTASAYYSTRSSLSKFFKNRHIAMSNVDATLVKEYEVYLQKTGIKGNTICYYMRNFKSIYAQAIADGVKAPNLSPFRAVSSKPQKTVKRALDRDTISRINKIILVGKRCTYTLSRDIFMFSFLTRGMPFVDIFHLKKRSINNNIITYCRQKTGQWLQVELTDESMKIIKRYDSDGEYVFPMLNKVADSDVRKAYRVHLDKTNRQLKQIGKMLELKMPLTTYVARHCWATQAKECGFSTAVISEGLGHSSERITQIYLKEFDRKVLDEANKKITEQVFV